MGRPEYYDVPSFLIPKILDDLGINGGHQRGSWLDMKCPLHTDRSPSFSVNTESGLWLCRHTGKTGNIFQLAKAIRGETWDGTKQWLSGRVKASDISTEEVLMGLLTPPPKPKVVSPIVPAEWITQYESLPERKTVQYFLNRGFTTDTALQFGVRWDKGLRRLMWPVKGRNDELVGFITRYIDPDAPLRYVNSPGLQRTLFPLNLFDDSFFKSTAILCEGPLDSMYLHQIGYTNALSMLGSSLKDEQLEWLIGHVRNVWLCPDNDEAGQTAMRKVVQDLGAYVDIKILTVPTHMKDVQEMSELDIHIMVGDAKGVL